MGSGDAHVQSAATRHPRPQAIRARDASLLPFRLPARPSPGAPWARGLLSTFWERGSPDLPACGLRRGSKGGPARPIFINTYPKTLARGQASRGERHGASSGTASSGWLARRQRDQGGVPHEVPVTQSMTTKGAGRASAVQCPPFLFGAKGASAGESIKQRHPFWCNKTKTSPTVGRRSSWSPERRHHRAFGRRGPTLVRISVLDVPLQNGQLLAPFPLNIWGRGPGPPPINRTSHPQGRGI